MLEVGDGDLRLAEQEAQAAEVVEEARLGLAVAVVDRERPRALGVEAREQRIAAAFGDERALHLRVGLEPAVADLLGELDRAVRVALGGFPFALKLVAARAPFEGLRAQPVALDPAALAEAKREREQRDRVGHTRELEPAAAEAEQRLGALEVGERGSFGERPCPLGNRVGRLDVAEVQPGPGLGLQDAERQIGSGGARDVHAAQRFERLLVAMRLDVALGLRERGRRLGPAGTGHRRRVHERGGDGGKGLECRSAFHAPIQVGAPRGESPGDTAGLPVTG